jgi:hypothetical protein
MPPPPPPALWAQVDAEADADGQQQQQQQQQQAAAAVSAARPGSAASDSAQLLEDWHMANDESSAATHGYETMPMTQSTDARATLLEVSERSQD